MEHLIFHNLYMEHQIFMLFLINTCIINLKKFKSENIHIKLQRITYALLINADKNILILAYALSY